jgi:hypothetical protein
MNPLIALAATVLPDILKAVVGDKAGTVAGAVTQAVAQVTQTQDPEAARNKLNADPAALAALQLKLAEIAADQDDKRQQAQLALIKEQNEQESKRRQADLTQFRAEIEDTKSARSTFSELALANNPMAWGAPAVSIIVTLGFFGILTLLIGGFGDLQADGPVAQIINISVGALAAAFATVVSFWLGSSQGSRTKDAATIQLQAEHVDSQAKQNQMLQNTVQAQVKQTQALQSTVQSAIAAAPTVDAPKTSNFRRCLDIVWAQQRANADAPGSPGGATQFGVTLGLLRDWRQNQTLTDDDVRKLDRDEACEIYRTRYWNVLRCDDLPVGVDLVVFDFGVDAGPGQAARALQQVVGAQADSSVGPATVAATKTMSANDVVQEVCDRRLEYYRNQPNAADFIRIWTNRTNAVEKAALDMISSAAAA